MSSSTHASGSHSNARYQTYHIDDLDEALYLTYPPGPVPRPRPPAPETQTQPSDWRVFRTPFSQNASDPALGLSKQEYDCLDPTMGNYPKCRACIDIAASKSAGLPPPSDLACSWKNIRGIAPKRDRNGLFKTPDGDGEDDGMYFADDRQLPMGASHALKAAHEQAGGAGRIRSPLRHMLDQDPSKTESVMATLAVGILPMLQGERDHTLTDNVFERAGDVDDFGLVRGGVRCDHCSHFMIGSFQCAKCGKELCFNCRQVVMDASASPSRQKRESVLSCLPRDERDGYFQQHDPADFFAIARISTEVLSMDIALAQGLAFPYEARSRHWIKEMALSRGETVSGFTYTEKNIYRGIVGKATRTVMISPMLPRAGQDLLVARAIVQTDGPSLLRHFEPVALTDHQLRRVMAEGTRMPAKFEDGTGENQRGVLSWSQVYKLLTAEPKNRTHVDIRDFPKDGELGDVADGLTKAFLALSRLPQMPKSEAEATSTTLDRHPDLLQWVPGSPWRDAQSKVYAATEVESGKRANTALHVDEAGAVNTCVWTYDGQRNVKAVPEIGQGLNPDGGFGPFKPEFIDNDPPHQPMGRRIPPEEQEEVAKKFRKEREDVFLKPKGRGNVAAKWIVFPPAARQHMQAAANRLVATGHVDEVAAGSVLFNHEKDVNKEFVDALVHVGGEECAPFVIDQRVGETVVIPPGFSHQVSNVQPSVKVAKDVMPLLSIPELMQIQKERAVAAQDGSTPGQDACMLLPTLYNAWRAGSEPHLEALAKNELQPIIEGLNIDIASFLQRTASCINTNSAQIRGLQDMHQTVAEGSTRVTQLQNAISQFGESIKQATKDLGRRIG
ncbi:hypothetical protein A4X13_0g7206 [Tilletia indica]|uniref:Uncharacterized protein n=1 Tax=Tilletia indica TaxID=43049 RepID=A0A177TA69_9BASI|nr:hypothetical protein A4X13_0g7206 [Tilletia indica]